MGNLTLLFQHGNYEFDDRSETLSYSLQLSENIAVYHHFINSMPNWVTVIKHRIKSLLYDCNKIIVNSTVYFTGMVDGWLTAV